jgi:hypothetical protein
MATAKKSKTKAPAKEKKPGVGDLAIQLLRDGKSNEDVLAAVQKKFPDSAVSISSIAWYRNKLRSDGEKVPTARDVKKKAKAAK